MTLIVAGCAKTEEAAPAEAAPAEAAPAEAAPAEAAPAEAAPAEAAPAEAAPAEAAPAEAAPAEASNEEATAPTLAGKWSVDVETFKASPMFSQMPAEQQAMMTQTLGLLSFEFTDTDFIYGHGPKKIARKYAVSSHADKTTVLAVTDEQGITTNVNVAWTETGITIQEQNRPGPLPLTRN